MKICTKCKQAKTVSDFFVKDKTRGKLHTQCKNCYKVQRQHYYSEHYEKYRDEYRKRAKERRTKLKTEYRNNLLDFLSDKSCVICKISDPVVLEFDHIDLNTKSFSISQSVKLGYRWDRVLAEIDKCQVMCANCHKRKTSREFGWYKNLTGGTERI